MNVLLLDDLKARFPMQNVSPYGECIVVPGAEFDPDWEVELEDGGFMVLLTDIDRKPVTLVQLKKPVGVATPSPEAAPSLKGTDKGSQNSGPKSHWEPEEDELLIKLWNQKLPVKKIVDFFRGSYTARSPSAIINHTSVLQQLGMIKSRFVIKSRFALKNGGSETLQGREEAEKKKHPTPIVPSIPTTIRTPIPAPETPKPESEAVKLLGQIRAALIPKEYNFDYHCRTCGTIGNADDAHVWQYCPICGKPLIIWNITSIRTDAQ